MQSASHADGDLGNMTIVPPRHWTHRGPRHLRPERRDLRVMSGLAMGLLTAKSFPVAVEFIGSKLAKRAATSYFLKWTCSSRKPTPCPHSAHCTLTLKRFELVRLLVTSFYGPVLPNSATIESIISSRVMMTETCISDRILASAFACSWTGGRHPVTSIFCKSSSSKFCNQGALMRLWKNLIVCQQTLFIRHELNSSSRDVRIDACKPSASASAGKHVPQTPAVCQVVAFQNAGDTMETWHSVFNASEGALSSANMKRPHSV